MKTMRMKERVSNRRRRMTACLLAIAGAGNVFAASGDWKDNRETAWPNNGNVNGNVYTINTARELAQFAFTVSTAPVNAYAGKTVVLAEDIDLSERYWQPAGTDFKGVFDGNGKTVTGMTITLAALNTAYAGGLFASLAADAVVRDLTLEAVDIQFDVYGSFNITVGSITGGTPGASSSGFATIENCRVDGVINTRNAWTGGGASRVGGIVGELDNGSVVRDCVSSVSVTASGRSVSVGGIVGNLRTKSRAWNILNMGPIHGTSIVSGQAANVGGLVGLMTYTTGHNDVYIANGFSTGSVAAAGSGTKYVGGVVGYGAGVSTSVANLYWLTDLAAKAFGQIATGTLPGSVIAVDAPAPGELVSTHSVYNTKILLSALNTWAVANSGDGYLGWTIKNGVNGGYPVLDRVYPNEISEQFLSVSAIDVVQAAGSVTLRWAPAQIEGTLIHYEIFATDDLALDIAGWDVYAHDGAVVVIDDLGTAEHTVTLKPALLDNPLGDKGFFKVKAVTQH